MGILGAVGDVFPADAEALLADGARAQTLGRHDVGPAWDGKVVRNLVRVPEFHHRTFTHDHRGRSGLHARDLDRRVLGGQDLRLGAHQNDDGVAARRRRLHRDRGVLNPPVAQKSPAGLEFLRQVDRAAHGSGGCQGGHQREEARKAQRRKQTMSHHPMGPPSGKKP